ncbi:MAG: bifunctional adenosylcobinamide kinase/adenosylcobinamide-phosphate guanylyltransferase [SAR202 cluster bacterium]|nr:bifunctional adenosylcobinamide kinase/adenosylcobinamide-phosphate guanylyltransferase [SAR202 cluster bacterium]
MKGELVLVTGGVRSGKSAFAQSMAEKSEGKVLFVATAQELDKDMWERIRRHRESRPREWATLEEPLDVAGALRRWKGGCDFVLLDCVTLWVTNLLLRDEDGPEESVLGPVHDVLEWRRRMSVSMVLVTNEVGMGVVPANTISRRFSDLLGKANQMLAGASDRVYLMVSGLPVQVKPGMDTKSRRG